MQRALAAQMRQFPGREQVVYDYYRNNPEAVARLRAPIFEEKVVDYLLELVTGDRQAGHREELTSRTRATIASLMTVGSLRASAATPFGRRRCLPYL